MHTAALASCLNGATSTPSKHLVCGVTPDDSFPSNVNAVFKRVLFRIFMKFYQCCTFEGRADSPRSGCRLKAAPLNSVVAISNVDANEPRVSEPALQRGKRLRLVICRRKHVEHVQ